MQSALRKKNQIFEYLTQYHQRPNMIFDLHGHKQRYIRCTAIAHLDDILLGFFEARSRSSLSWNDWQSTLNTNRTSLDIKGKVSAGHSACCFTSGISITLFQTSIRQRRGNCQCSLKWDPSGLLLSAQNVNYSSVCRRCCNAVFNLMQRSKYTRQFF